MRGGNMQRCPKCGYKDGFNWPALLWMCSFMTLYVLWMMGNYTPREYRWAGLAAFFVFNLGVVWMALRNARNYREYRKLNPSITDRVKDHIRAH
jgi:hypothetical protein